MTASRSAQCTKAKERHDHSKVIPEAGRCRGRGAVELCPLAGALAGALLNDVHSGLNPTTVRDVIPVRSAEDVQRVVEHAVRNRTAISVSGDGDPS